VAVAVAVARWNSLRGTDLTMRETRHNENFMGSMVFKPRRFRNN